MGFDSNHDFAPPTVLLSFALGRGISFFGGIQHSPVNGCSTASCNFGVLVWEDERTSFYSAILCVLRNMLLGFPHSSVSKESACNAGVPGSISGSGRSPGEGNGNLLQCYCLENPMDRVIWQVPVHVVTRVRHDLVTKERERETSCMLHSLE